MGALGIVVTACRPQIASNTKAHIFRGETSHQLHFNYIIYPYVFISSGVAHAFLSPEMTSFISF